MKVRRIHIGYQNSPSASPRIFRLHVPGVMNRHVYKRV